MTEAAGKPLKSPAKTNLFSWISRTFTRKKEYRPNLLRINRADCQQFPELYSDIFCGKFDGVIIEDFLSKSELDHFSHNFKACTEGHPELVEVIDNGFTFGKTFFDIPEESVYKALIPKYETIELELFGFSLKERFLETIRHFAQDKQASVARYPDNSAFLSNTVRVLTPDQGGLYIHADLHIHESFSEARTIMSLIDRSNLLSFFTLLQKPEKGGRLMLYDHLYPDTPEYVYEPGEKKYDLIRSFVGKFPVYAIDLEPGNLILFNAGTRWHAIEPIAGSIPRITAGCFNSYSADHSTIYIWS